MYLHNFNPEKSKNPFAYFTQIIYYAFLRRIQKEKKKQTELKQKLISTMVVDETMVTSEHDDQQYNNQYLEFLQDNMYSDDAMAVQDMKDAIKDKKERKGALDEFME